MVQTPQFFQTPRDRRLGFPTTLSTSETLSWLIIEGAERVARETCELYLSIASVAARREDSGLQDEAEDQFELWQARHEKLCSEGSASLQRGIMQALPIIQAYAVTGVRLALLEQEHGDAMLAAYLEDGE